ncbi:peroxiredoxin Q [Panus rudis PR-1116 ss-1]|nr:peroxiredoxin Q [Panus rudis PR-1116 ss-1]
MPHPLIGQPAPPLSLPDTTGETYNLTPGQNGAPIALFFYPKAGTYGCTKEACQFRDAIAEKGTFGGRNVQVVGISGDTVEKQKEFKEKNGLTYPILSDGKGEARKAYHVGKGLLGLVDARVTFIIDSQGIVRDALDATMNYGAHTKFVNKWLEKLDAETKGGEGGSESTPAAETNNAPATTESAPAVAATA